MVERLRLSQANRKRIENIDSCFGTQGETLWTEGRVLVGEGVLMKACRKKPKPRQFFLFNDLLVYGSILISKKRYHKQRIIPLEQVQLQDIKDDGNIKHAWQIMTRGKSFTVYAATEMEKQEWMLHINRCVQEVIKNGKRPASEHAAVWIPDSEAPECMCCHASTFTVLNRRHHCRNCGNVVCGGCSTHRLLLPVSKHPVRVCDTCYNKRCNSNEISVPVPSTAKTDYTHFETDESEEEDGEDKPVEDNQTTFYGSTEPSTSTTL